MDKKSVPELCEPNSVCCGCSACAAICPAGAITMRADGRGFQYPAIDETKCVRCGKCVKVCDFKKSQADEKTGSVAVYAARAKDGQTVRESSSGGVFTVLSDWFLEQQGAVASVVYDYQQQLPVFRLYTDKQTRDAARGSKYIQAVMGDIYAECVSWLKENPDKQLLFVGVGCQVAGFRNILKEKGLRDRAVLVDLICHGQPSSALWQDYIRLLEQAFDGKIDYVTFKDKRNGWNYPMAYARINGAEVSLEAYSCWFYEQYSLRSSCFRCPYTCVKRDTDLTIGDYWGIESVLPEFYDPMGNSLILVQSDTGRRLLAELKDRLVLVESAVKDCLQPRLCSPAQENPRAEKFWRDYTEFGVEKLIEKYREDGKLLAACKKIVRKGKRGIRKICKILGIRA